MGSSRAARFCRATAVAGLAIARVGAAVAQPAEPRTLAATRLVPGAPLERAAKPGEIHQFVIGLRAGDLLDVQAEERGADVEVSLFGPDATRLAWMDGPLGGQGGEALAWIAAAPGDYRLDVRVLTASAAASFALALAPARRPTAEDPRRIAARRAFAGATERLARGDAEAKTQALQLYLATLAEARAAGDRWLEARALLAVGWLEGEAGQAQTAIEAIERLEESARVWQELGQPRFAARALDQAGRLTPARGEHRHGLELHLRAAELWRGVGARAEEAGALLQAGYCASFSGDYDRAIALLEDSRHLAQSAGDAGAEANALNDLGLAQRGEGRLHEALASFAAARPLAEAAGDGALAAELHANTGNALSDLGEVEKALGEYQLAVEAYRAAGNRRGEGQALSYVGGVWALLGEQEKALAAYTPALAALRSIQHSFQAAVLQRMGTAHHKLGRLQAAERDFGEALVIWRANHLRWGEGMTLAELGALRAELGEAKPGLELLAQGLALSRAEGDRPREATALDFLGEVRLRQGEAMPSADACREAAALWLALGNPRRQAASLAGLARAERSLGRLAEARAHIEEALAILERLRRNFLSDELRASYLGAVRGYFEFYLDLLLELDRQQPRAGLARAALLASEESRARVLLDLLARSGIDLGASLPTALRDRRDANAKAVSATQSELLALRARGRDDSRRGSALGQQLERLEGERERLEAEVRRASPAYSEVALPAPLPVDEILALLPADTALLEYFLGSEGSFLMVATHDGVGAFRLPPEKEIAEAVAGLRAALQEPGRRRFGELLAGARRLHQMLIDPAAAALAGRRRWLVAPDGPLYYLPFEALLARPPVSDLGRPQPYLVLDRVVSYVPSASVLARLAGPADAAAAQALLAFGDPDYGAGEAARMPGAVGALVRGVEGGDAGWVFRRLPETGREVAAIARLFPAGSARVFLRAAAREEVVKREASTTRARRWHFAAHALIDEARPQDSGLVLALDEDPAEDGLLQVHEIFGLRLPCELVVLSACETAMGPQVRGEGVLGLTRAFLFAGARGLVASLWQVEDRSTADLMVVFYERLQHGRDAAEALRDAKLELLARGRFSHPFHWAPFILTGVPR